MTKCHSGVQIMGRSIVVDKRALVPNNIIAAKQPYLSIVGCSSSMRRILAFPGFMVLFRVRKGRLTPIPQSTSHPWAHPGYGIKLTSVGETRRPNVFLPRTSLSTSPLLAGSPSREIPTKKRGDSYRVVSNLLIPPLKDLFTFKIVLSERFQPPRPTPFPSFNSVGSEGASKKKRKEWVSWNEKKCRI